MAAKPDIEQEELFRSIHSSEDPFESRDSKNLKADVWQSSIENLPYQMQRFESAMMDEGNAVWTLERAKK